MKLWIFGIVALVAMPACGQIVAKDIATLVVSNTGSGPVYIEGAISFVRVESNGKAIEEKRLERNSVSFSLRPGEYELVGYDRPCDGNCGYLDPPTDRCSHLFGLRRGDRLLATIRMQAGDPCRISFRRT